MSGMKKKKHRAVFVDRDGTLIKEANYPDALDKIQLYKKSAGAIRMLKKKGYKLVVVSNQAGVSYGYFTEAFVKKSNAYIKKQLKDSGAAVDAFYYCPHHPEKAAVKKYRKRCGCRKPDTGMLKKAAKRFNIDLKKSYVVGDKLSDIKTAENAGARSVLVLTGHGKKERNNIRKEKIKPDYTAADFMAAAGKIPEVNYGEEKK